MNSLCIPPMNIVSPEWLSTNEYRWSLSEVPSKMSNNQYYECFSRSAYLIKRSFILFSRATVLTFKLSPNLRVSMKPPKKVQTTTEILEFEKLDNILETVRLKPMTVAEIKFCQFQVQTDRTIISSAQTNLISSMDVSYTNIA